MIFHRNSKVIDPVIDQCPIIDYSENIRFYFYTCKLILSKLYCTRFVVMTNQIIYFQFSTLKINIWFIGTILPSKVVKTRWKQVLRIYFFFQTTSFRKPNRLIYLKLEIIGIWSKSSHFTSARLCLFALFTQYPCPENIGALKKSHCCSRSWSKKYYSLYNLCAFL